MTIAFADFLGLHADFGSSGRRADSAAFFHRLEFVVVTSAACIQQNLLTLEFGFTSLCKLAPPPTEKMLIRKFKCLYSNVQFHHLRNKTGDIVRESD